MRAIHLVAAIAVLLGGNTEHSRADQIQTVRSVQGQTVCIYNCAGTIRTVTTGGSVCPVILE